MSPATPQATICPGDMLVECPASALLSTHSALADPQVVQALSAAAGPLVKLTSHEVGLSSCC